MPSYTTVLEPLRHELVNNSKRNQKNYLCSFDESWKFTGQTHTVFIFQVYIAFTWVAEKSTHCKNGQFSPNAWRDTSVIPKQPPKSMIFSSRQLTARARTPSSVRLQHRFKEASCRYEQEEATAFIPEGKHNYISMSYMCIYIWEMWLIFILAITSIDIPNCMLAFCKVVHLWGYIYFPVMLSLLRLYWNISGIFYIVCSISFRISAVNGKPLLSTSKLTKVIRNQIRSLNSR